MKKIFISGATGFIGSRLSLRLAESGHIVHALYRSEKKTEVIRHPNIHLFRGDIMDLESVKPAVSGCSEVYHVAAFAKVWTRDPSEIYHLNIDGAMNVIRAAIDSGVRKIVLTSTAGVLGSSDGPEIDESFMPGNFYIHYEHSKAILESVVRSLAAAGSNIVIVNPSRVYGPGLLSESNGVTRMIKRYMEGRWRIIPGNGRSIGNYVYIDDVVEGHILAMERGKAGERYILGGENADYLAFFGTLSEVSERKYKMFHLPLSVMMAAAYAMLFVAGVTGKSPMIIPALVRKFHHNFPLNIMKARSELGYLPVSLNEGISKTIEWLKNESDQ